MIISASRRTGLPAFYADWLVRRFRAGYCLRLRHEPDREAGANFFDRLNSETTAQRLLKRLRQIGYQVELHPLLEAEAACPVE
jgi:hypothetical protein